MTVFGPRRRRPSPRWPSGPTWSDTIEHEIVTGLGARGCAAPPAPSPCGASGEDPCRGDRRRPELRARGLARLGRRGRRRPRPRRRTTSCALTIDPDGVWRDDEQSPIGLAGAVARAARVRGGAPGAARPARRGRHPRRALRPGRRPVRRLRASARVRWRWTSGPPSWSPAGSGSRVADGRAAHPGDRRGVRLHPPGRGQAGRRGVQPRRHPGPATPTSSPPALAAAFALDDRVLVEEVVAGREVDVAVLGRPDGSRVVAPALEIVADGIFDHATKYDGSADFRIPAALADAERKALEEAAVAMYDAARLRRRRPGRLLRHRRRPGAQRGQHDAGLHRAVAGAEDVRGRRDVVRRPARPAGPRRAPPARRVTGTTQRIAGLDLLRGIAIGLVMLRHAVPELAPGAGVVGVVMFFALSGYLITGLLSGELDRTGRLDLRRFYARRARRLVPALLALVAAVVVVTLLLDPLGDRDQLLKTVVVALTWTGNLPFGHASDATFHLWTLATEEQFYLLWPALLLLLGAPAGPARRGRRCRRPADRDRGVAARRPGQCLRAPDAVDPLLRDRRGGPAARPSRRPAPPGGTPGTGRSGRPQRGSIAGSRAHLPGGRTGHRDPDGGAAPVVAHPDRAEPSGAPGAHLAGHHLLRRLPVELPAHPVAAPVRRARQRSAGRRPHRGRRRPRAGTLVERPLQSHRSSRTVSV